MGRSACCHYRSMSGALAPWDPEFKEGSRGLVSLIVFCDLLGVYRLLDDGSEGEVARGLVSLSLFY